MDDSLEVGLAKVESVDALAGGLDREADWGLDDLKKVLDLSGRASIPGVHGRFCAVCLVVSESDFSSAADLAWFAERSMNLMYSVSMLEAHMGVSESILTCYSTRLEEMESQYLSRNFYLDADVVEIEPIKRYPRFAGDAGILMQKQFQTQGPLYRWVESACTVPEAEIQAS